MALLMALQLDLSLKRDLDFPMVQDRSRRRRVRCSSGLRVVLRPGQGVSRRR
jgi:hypothetical protein